MAYITSEEVKQIRTDLKARFPKFKFGVTKHHHSQVTVTIKKSNHKFEDLLTNNDRNHVTVNHYWLDQNVKNKEDREFLSAIHDIILTSPAKVTGKEFRNNSDIQSDYFDVSYYYTINIGSWDTPYEIV